MADTLSVYLERAILKHVFGLEAYTPPTISVGLGGGLVGLELSPDDNDGYARVETTADAWTTAVNGVISNAVAITFPEATADWPTMPSSFFLSDSPAWPSPNRLATADLTVPKPIARGHRPRFDIGTLEIALDEDASGFYLGELFDGGYADVGRGVFSDYLENKIMDHVFGCGNRNYTQPDLYVGLLTSYPSDEATNDDCGEVPWLENDSYVRTPLLSTDWEMSDPVFGEADIWNKEVIPFLLGAQEYWGIVVALALFDVPFPIGEGNLLMYGPMPPAEIQIGSEPRFAAGAFDAQPGLDFFFSTG